MRILVLVFSSLLAGVTYAIPVTWTLDATFSEGLVATGQFTYDADTNQYTNVSIFFDGDLTFERDTSPGFSYPRLVVGDEGIWDPYTQLRYTETFSITFDQDLTDAGGAVDLASGYYYLGVQDLADSGHQGVDGHDQLATAWQRQNSTIITNPNDRCRWPAR